MVLSLYPYQEVAVERILEQEKMLVSYDMGLGKTAITISAMERLMAEQRITDTVLVIVLASLKYQWLEEITRWAPESRAAVVDGTPRQRQELFASIDEEPPDYVIVNYEMVVKEYAWFSQHRWGAVVADEASAIKGFRSKRSRAIKNLARDVDIRVALTGTPISNGKPEEIFSLMEFVDPDLLGNYRVFDRTFIVRNPNGWVERYRNLPTLHNRLDRAVIRKLQTDPDVSEYLPDVIDAPPTMVPWDTAGWNLYRTIARQLVAVLDEATEMFGSSWSFNVAAYYGQGRDTFNPQEAAITGEIMTRIQALRMLCSHPDALRASAQRFNERQDETGAGSAYAAWLQQNGLLDVRLRAPKFDAVRSYITDFLSADERNKIVVFSSFRDVLPLLATALEAYEPRLYHGGMTATVKETNKKYFQESPTSRVLLSSDAGGFGVNLPEANLLINYDLPYASGTALQRNSRIIRAASPWPSVRIDRFLMQGSLELRQWEALRYKAAVSEAVLAGVGVDERGGVLGSVASLRSALQDL